MVVRKSFRRKKNTLKKNTLRRRNTLKKNTLRRRNTLRGGFFNSLKCNILTEFYTYLKGLEHKGGKTFYIFNLKYNYDKNVSGDWSPGRFYGLDSHDFGECRKTFSQLYKIRKKLMVFYKKEKLKLPPLTKTKTRLRKKSEDEISELCEKRFNEIDYFLKRVAHKLTNIQPSTAGYQIIHRLFYG